MPRFRFLHSKPFVLLMPIVVIALISVTSLHAAPSHDFTQVKNVVSNAQLQDSQPLPEPQLCNNPDNLVSMSDSTNRIQVNDFTTLLTYVNPLEQAFVLTISSPDPEFLRRFLSEGRFCLEAVASDNNPSQGEAADIAIGDIFVGTVTDALTTAGKTLLDLVTLRDTLSDEAAQKEVDGPTLRQLLQQLGVKDSEIVAIPQKATEAALAQIRKSVDQGTLNSNRAEELQAQVSEQFAGALDEPDATIIPTDLANVPPIISTRLHFILPGKEQASNYQIFAIFDPTILPGARNQQYWTVASATSLNVKVTVTGGKVSAYLYNGNTYQWSDTRTYNGIPNSPKNIMKSGWWVANKLVIRGWQATNSYNCTCYPLTGP